MKVKKNKKITTIKIEKETKDRLDNLKEYERETYNETINKMINIINITIKNPIAGARIFKNIKRKKQGKSNKQQVYQEIRSSTQITQQKEPRQKQIMSRPISSV